MKTCKDCKFYFTDPSITPMTPYECRLNPVAEKIDPDHWCGQFKELDKSCADQWTPEEITYFQARMAPNRILTKAEVKQILDEFSKNNRIKPYNHT